MFSFLQYLHQRVLDAKYPLPSMPISIRNYGRWDREEGLREVTRVVFCLPDPMLDPVNVTVNGRPVNIH